MILHSFGLIIVGTLFITHQVISVEISEDAFFSVPELIVKYGFPFEQHDVTTEDKYILALHRIPDGAIPVLPKRGPPILLVHGLWASSADFIIQGPTNSLAYLLANAGYDVWLANTRGGTYSRRHETMNPDAQFLNKFWDFSYHDKGVHDLPAIIDYILAETGNSQIIYLGSSEGSAALFVMGSEKPAYLTKVKAHICYAPAVFVEHTTLMLARVFIIFETLGYGSIITGVLGHFDFAPDCLALNLLNWFCNAHFLTSLICDNVISPVIDSGPGQIHNDLIDVVLGHMPASTSTKQLLHFAQAVRNKNFGKYQDKLTSPYHPYDLSTYNVPTYVFFSANDKVVSPVDIETLEQALPNGFEEKWLFPDFGHVDFSFGKHAKDLVYSKTIVLLNTLTLPIP